jgi:hypothetical protein|tara:strand:+ start:2760 stop:3095 length:336 start_codon:yes stop_codon:yes gene_type:complete
MEKYKPYTFTLDDVNSSDDDLAILDMIPKKGRENWRKRHKYLATKPILSTEFPTLASLMIEDGLNFVLSDDGYEWYHGEYRVATTVIREVWGLTDHQWRRFMRWGYKHWPL